MSETPRAAEVSPEPWGTKRIRVDKGSARGTDAASGRGSLLRAFGAWSKSKAKPAKEHRSEARHDVLECRAWVGWKTWRRFEMNSALVINLSRGGSQIFLDAPPPPFRDVWVFLETPGQNAVVRASVLEFRVTPSGQCAIRVAFNEPCPFSVFEAAVCGLAAANPKNRVASPSPHTVSFVPV